MKRNIYIESGADRKGKEITSFLITIYLYLLILNLFN